MVVGNQGQRISVPVMKKSRSIVWSSTLGLALLSLVSLASQGDALAKGKGQSDKILQFQSRGLPDPFMVRFKDIRTKPRVLHFPEYSLGEVTIADKSDEYQNCRRGAAKGTVEVPPGKFVTFIPAARFYQNPAIIKTLPPDGIDCVWFSAMSLADAEDGMCDRALAHIGHLKGLLELNLDKSDATDAGFAYASELPNLQKVTAFQASVKGAALAKFGGLKQLRYLRLPSTYMQDENLKYVAGLPGLKALSLGHASISDKGVKNLANCHQLVSLDLENCPRVTDESIKVLVGLKNLRYLTLAGTSMTSDAAMQLKGIPYYTLSWPHTRAYTRADISAIRAAFPGVNVVFPNGDRRKPVDADTRSLFAPLR